MNELITRSFECTKCGETKPVTEYHKLAASSTGYDKRCKACKADYHAERYAAKGRDERLRKVFNITAERYDAMLAEQNFSCAVCQRHMSNFKRSLAVDHDHSCCPGKKSCGKCVRGLLCWGCNSALGNTNDDVDRLMGLAAYVIQHKERNDN